MPLRKLMKCLENGMILKLNKLQLKKKNEIVYIFFEIYLIFYLTKWME